MEQVELKEEDEDAPLDRRTVRSLVCFWIFGLCSSYAYSILLVAAADIIHKNGGGRTKHRDCTYMCTGAILLAGIIPGFVMRTVVPFCPFYVRVRISCCILLTISGLIIVALSPNLTIALLGTCITSFSAGLGEVTFLQFTTFYSREVISSWSSGSGGAGVISAASYAIFKRMGFETILLIMLLIPALLTITFFFILPEPEITPITTIQRNFNLDEIKKPKETFLKKVKLIPGLCKTYMIPFGMVYFLEYYINQGTFELVNFKHISISFDGQYRWLLVDYQIGVFIARSSVNILYIKKIWIIPILQSINVVIFTTEIIFHYIPHFWILILVAIWEGILGGAAYVNTFYRIAHEVEEEDKQFSMGIMTFSSCVGKIFAGIVAIVVHNAICEMPMYEVRKSYI